MADATRIPDSVTLPELTLRGVLLGALITVIFTASNVFLGLKVGLTFSSAIPAAVISMSVLRMFRDANILENNMVQTQASAAGTLSAIIFILPALVMMGHWHGFPFWQTLAICAAGGMLGVMFTIPLRHIMVVQSDLPYPEGVAAAEILRVGSAEAPDTAPGRRGASGMGDILAGGGVAALVSLATGGLRVLGDSFSWWGQLGAAVFRLPMGFSLALLGAGYLIGIVAGMAMLVGLLIAWLVAVPVLTATTPIPDGQSISAFANGLWASQVRFIGAGVIGVGAIWTLATLFMPMVRGVRASFAAFGRSGEAAYGSAPRTERDLPSRWISLITLALVAVLVAVFAVFLQPAMLSPGARWGLVAYAVAFAIVFGFLVAAACGYMAGLIGSSTSPISGVGIVAIVLVSLLMLAIQRGDGLLATPQGLQMGIALAIFTTSAVVAVASISNDNLQDLKTGWLVGATPWRQQVALLIGCVVGAAVISPVLELLYNAYGFGDALPRPGMDPAQALAAPQATLMLAIAQGIFTHQLNWTMILIGMGVGVALIVIDQMLRRTCRVARLPVLAVGIGIYLPPSASAPIVVGAMLAWLLEGALRRRAAAAGQAYERYAEGPNRRGVLVASGLIVGESLVGVLLAAVIGATGDEAPLAVVGAGFGPTAEWLGFVVFAAVAVWIYRRVVRTGPEQA
ncbi:OPT family oligopeptide transporter [Bordetella bronchiseptica]|uniref:Oligopeptide transporter, OPT family n=2 Tax=Bordetella bronchiseptica TaxID=518 RepID=A0ABR4RJ00_BORBO|nr:oligopeptide transporter, OPT family [Bordetella bronchiseptica]SHS26022.1 Oligopeptide transporter OPT [Mycobacteroides abscessus subsp. abscessus]AZW24469.1 oligopeptide transporter, OPT family [Bordetella bronchiseptica]KCV37259.1 oligopeptide transporter, OPT family [Bordetella bronchiseptica 00-P-2796]KDC10709.1 oligopeptide transporter, OPT family [Bordetella bronchiseptica E013]KDC12500.1 oligopeptide transporter, OPT family [Bordetella bronchiseptica E012]